MSVTLDELQDLYQLTNRYCNLGPVQDLLRRYQQDDSVPDAARKEIRITGKNALEVTTVNLRRAVESGAIPIRDVFNLLQDAEENGRQHIFLFKVKTNAAHAQLNDRETICKALLGKSLDKVKPRLRLQPHGFSWSDFRSLGKNGWLAKLYGHDTFEERIPVEDSDDPDTRWIKIVRRDRRSVCVCKWRPALGLLELRVADSDAAALFDELINQLQPVFSVHKLCTPWDLGKARQRLLQEEPSHPDLYTCGDWSALDKESYLLQGSPHLQDPDSKVLLADSTRELMHQIATSAEHEKRRLVVHWKEVEDSGIKRSLRTVLGTLSHSNEVIVSAQSNSRALNYVINQLLSFDS